MPNVATAVDLNSDGKLDLAVGSGTRLNVLHNQGAGTFAAPMAYSQGLSGPTSIAAADLNDDARPDLAVTNPYRGNVNVLLNSFLP